MLLRKFRSGWRSIYQTSRETTPHSRRCARIQQREELPSLLWLHEMMCMTRSCNLWTNWRIPYCFQTVAAFLDCFSRPMTYPLLRDGINSRDASDCDTWHLTYLPRFELRPSFSWRHLVFNLIAHLTSRIVQSVRAYVRITREIFLYFFWVGKINFLWMARLSNNLFFSVRPMKFY